MIIENEMKLVPGKTIRVYYPDPEFKSLQINAKGDWIDLKAAETVELSAGDFKLISFGVVILIPAGFEAHIAPRSSTFKNWGIIQTNSIGIIDNSYSGINDIWRYPVYATRDTIINKGDRIAQFRIVPNMCYATTLYEMHADLLEIQNNEPTIYVNEYKDHWGGDSRGGFGSTGIK